MFATMMRSMFTRRWWSHHTWVKGGVRWWWHRTEETMQMFRANNARNVVRTVHLDISTFKSQFIWGLSFKIENDCEGTYSFHLGIPFLLALYVTIDAGLPKWLVRFTGDESASWGWYATSSGISLSWGGDSNSSPTLRGWNTYFPWSRFKGKEKYKRLLLESRILTFQQPAFGEYPISSHKVLIEKVQCTWTWGNPFVRSRTDVFYEIDFKDKDMVAPSFSGKYGKDGISAMNFRDVGSFEEAIKRYTDTVTEERRRRG
jgi:hypothetical protein